jgi:hypothetical protein
LKEPLVTANLVGNKPGNDYERYNRHVLNMAAFWLPRFLRQPHLLPQSGIIDVTQAKQIGKIVGADAIVTGSVMKIGIDLLQ